MDIGGIIALVFIAISVYNGVKKNQEQERQRLERRKARELSQPVQPPVLKKMEPQKPVVLHPIDMQKRYEEGGASKPKPTLSTEAAPIGPVLPEMVVETIKPEVSRVEKARPETAVTPSKSSETEEAQKFWKEPKAKSAQMIPAKVSKTVETEESADIPFNQAALVQGIIMAEVLQPPRARRPYQPIYLQNNK